MLSNTDKSIEWVSISKGLKWNKHDFPYVYSSTMYKLRVMGPEIVYLGVINDSLKNTKTT